MRKQTCVYWALASEESGGDDYSNYGQPQLTTPVEISCRWADKNEEFIGPNGTKLISQAKVYVEQDVDIGGVLMLGDEDDITDDDNVKENEGAYEIKAFYKTPNLKATEWLRTAFL